MNHNDRNQPPSPEPADLAMNRVLQAERDAEQAVAECEQEARAILKAAQLQAQRIAARTNRRISMLQMRSSQKLNRTIKDIERAGKQIEQAAIGIPFDDSLFGSVIDELAAELTTSGHEADTDRNT
jgi:vacuolar-type H+-ATPase subunit H